ncbi:MAG: exo-alpha-sialidase [Proteobacteria bacterium]|nr:exo-alpha-sialidase [Pseudomonadota bacterium]
MRRALLLGVAALLSGGIAVAQHQHPHMQAMDAFAADARDAFTATPAFGADGTLWLVRGMADRVLVSRSTDLGKSFSPQISVTPGPIGMDWGPDSRPQILITASGRLVVTWAVFKDKQFNGRVYATYSDDNGASFAAARPITADDASQRFQQTALDADGRIFAAWIDKRGAAAARAAGKPYPGAALAYAWSSDGKTFGDATVALDNTCECCRLGVALAGPGRPAVLFRNVFGGTTRDHAVITFENPTTPGPLRRVSIDDWKIDACPHHGPSLAIAADGSYHAAWFTGGEARQGIFYARADDGVASFSEPRALSSPERQPGRPYLLAIGNTVHLVWKEFDGTRTRILWQVSHDSGRSWSAAHPVADTDDASDHPLLIARKSQAFLSWLTKTEGYRLIALEDSP